MYNGCVNAIVDATSHAVSSHNIQYYVGTYVRRTYWHYSNKDVSRVKTKKCDFAEPQYECVALCWITSANERSRSFLNCTFMRAKKKNTSEPFIKWARIHKIYSQWGLRNREHARTNVEWPSCTYACGINYIFNDLLACVLLFRCCHLCATVNSASYVSVGIYERVWM